MNIVPMHKDTVVVAWPRIAELLQPMIDVAHGELSSTGLLRRVLNDELFVYGCVDDQGLLVAAVMTTITDFPDTGKRILEAPFVGGSRMSEWLPPLLETLKDVARNLGCTHLRGCGRPGWERVHPEFKKIRTVYEVTL